VKTWVALLRGVNVVGRRQVPMKRLAAAFERAGFRSVRTYIQSGNVIFQSPSGSARTLGTRIGRLVMQDFGFEPQVMVVSAAQLRAAVNGNPFPGARENHKALHIFFLAGRPAKPDLESLERVRGRREGFALKNGCFYLYTPDGFPDSVVRSRLERCLGVAATGRNWRTANALLRLLRE
jgi:uncharacterized protein (DUF1697 family)